MRERPDIAKAFELGKQSSRFMTPARAEEAMRRGREVFGQRTAR